MSKIKLSFKKQPRQTGLAGVGNPYPWVDIKIDKKKCGSIIPADWRRKYWGVQIMVLKKEPDNNPNCNWTWIFSKEKFQSEEDARDWVKDHIEYIMQHYIIRFSED